MMIIIIHFKYLMFFRGIINILQEICQIKESEIFDFAP